MMDEHFHYKCDVVTCGFSDLIHKTFLTQFLHVFGADHLSLDHGKSILISGGSHDMLQLKRVKPRTHPYLVFNSAFFSPINDVGLATWRVVTERETKQMTKRICVL